MSANGRWQAVYVYGPNAKMSVSHMVVNISSLIESNSLWKVTALQEGGHLMQVLLIHLYKVPPY